MPIESEKEGEIGTFIISRFVANAINVGDIDRDEPKKRYLISEENLYKAVHEIIENLPYLLK